METSEEKKSCENKKPCCLCQKMGGVFIVLIGVAILLRELDVLSEKNMWISISIIVILIGLKKVCGGMCKCCDKS
jgi:uncharacterized membrane protein